MFDQLQHIIKLTFDIRLMYISVDYLCVFIILSLYI